MRNYDENPIIINDYGAYFEKNAIIFISIFSFYMFFTSDFKLIEIFDIQNLSYLVWLLLLIFLLPFIFCWCLRCKDRPSYFKFEKEKIAYVYHEPIKPISKQIIHWLYFSSAVYEPKICDIHDIKEINFCVVSELFNRFGRFHYFKPYELYKKTSIGVHIGKSILFIYYTLNFILILPYKIYKFKIAKEPINLLNKNIVIKFKNRNYFLINIYSRRDLIQILNYFKDKDIPIMNKTSFIPQCQNMGLFTDKNEVWSDDPNDTEIPKDDWKRKMRRFFSLE